MMADAALAAMRFDNIDPSLATFGRALGWFQGQNNLRLSLVDDRDSTSPEYRNHLVGLRLARNP